MLAEVSIPRHFNGPLESGNGGYCAGVFAALIDGPAAVNLRRPIPLDEPAAFLVRFRTDLRAPVAVGAEHVVIGWPLARDGRKLRSASAILDAEGEALAVAEALMIEPRPE
ncbi:MAG TPA: hypothetical protein VFJ57_08085 [Solirubrobacterales bacterium]|nr:hypothetical protein [Solirubrobacterales bacterium]